MVSARAHRLDRGCNGAAGCSVRMPRSRRAALDDSGCGRWTRLRLVSAVVACATVAVLSVAYPGTASAWSQQPLQLPPSFFSEADSGQLTGVSCTSWNACSAVGDGDGAGPLVERWDGKAWSLQSVAMVDGGFPGLSSISCGSSRSCFAVGTEGTGSYSNTAIVERWNGSAWSFQPTGSQFPEGELWAVSCSSPVACMATGDDNDDGSPEAGRWNGRAWSGQTTGFDAGGLSCVSRNVCGFVGAPFQTTQPAVCAVAGFWTHGRWSQNLALPCGNHSRVTPPRLSAVSCTSASACTAVGSAVYGWNGQRWTLEPTALRPGESLSGVSCVSRTACVAVGGRRARHTTRAVVKRWNGSRWSTVYVSKLPGSQLNGVSCTSTRVCRAVGSYTYYISGYTATGAPTTYPYSAPLVESNG
jgi:hypothetical protein